MTTLHHDDRVMEVSQTSGTGNLLLGGPQAGYYTFFASFGLTQSFAYVAENPITGENEIGTGHLVDNGDGTYSIVRDTVERSSNANALVNFSGGRLYIANPLLASEADVFELAATAIQRDGSVDFTADQSMNGHKLTNVTDPTAAQDAATKAYVDAQVATAGNVKTTLPTTVDAVPAYSGTDGTLRPNTGVKIHSTSADKLEFVATFGALATAVDAATITLDFDQANDWLVPIGGNRTLAYTHANVDQLVWVLITQDATGGREPIWWSNIFWANGVAPVIDTTANSGWNAVELRCIGVDAYDVPVWYEVSRRGSNLAGSIFHTNGNSELVQLDADGKLPAIDGSQLTGLPTSYSVHGSGSLAFGSIGPGGGTATQTLTATGAVTGDSVTVAPRANLVGPFSFYAWVSAADTVTVQCMNCAGTAQTPATVTWDAWIFR